MKNKNEDEIMNQEQLQLEMVFDLAEKHNNFYAIKKLMNTTHSAEEVLFNIFQPIEKEPSIPINLKLEEFDSNLSDDEKRKIMKKNSITKSAQILAEKTQANREIILDEYNKLYVTYLDYESRVNINYNSLRAEEKRKYYKKNEKYYIKKTVCLTAVDKEIFDAITIIAANLKNRKSVKADNIVVTFSDIEIHNIVNNKARIIDNKIEFRDIEKKAKMPAYFKTQIENCLSKLQSTKITRVYKSIVKERNGEKIVVNNEKNYLMINSYTILENSSISKRKTDIVYEVNFSEDYSKYLMSANTFNLSKLKFELNENLILLDDKNKKMPKLPLIKFVIEYIVCDWNIKYKDEKKKQKEYYNLSKILYHANYISSQTDNISKTLVSELNKNKRNFNNFGIDWNPLTLNFMYCGEKRHLTDSLPLFDINRFESDIKKANEKSAKKSTL